MTDVILVVMYIACIVLIFAAGWIWGIEYEYTRAKKLLKMAEDALDEAYDDMDEVVEYCDLLCAINDRLTGRTPKPKQNPKKNAQKQSVKKVVPKKATKLR